MTPFERYRANAEAYLDRIYGKGNPDPSERPAVTALMAWLSGQANDAPELRELLAKHNGIDISLEEVQRLLEAYVSVFRVTHSEKYGEIWWQLKNEAGSYVSGAHTIIRNMGFEPEYRD